MANENTTSGPLTATVGEQLGEKGHLGTLEEARARVSGPGEQRAPRGRTGERRAASRGFPWGTLALAAIGWALVSGVARGVSARAGRLARRLRRR